MDKDFIEYLGYKASGPEIDLLTFDSYLITAWSVFILLKYLQTEPRAALRTFAEVQEEAAWMTLGKETRSSPRPSV